MIERTNFIEKKNARRHNSSIVSKGTKTKQKFVHKLTDYLLVTGDIDQT